MVKKITVYISLTSAIIILLFNTPEIRVGSGFIIGDGLFIFTYAGLVNKAKSIKVKFPNEDFINSKLIYIDLENNLAIIRLEKMPKVKKKSLIFAKTDNHQMDKYVFTIGYPWTNTQKDQYKLIEGSLSYLDAPSSKILKLKIPINPVHLGSPVLNSKAEVIGMLLTHQNLEPAKKKDEDSSFAVGINVLSQALEKANLSVARPTEPDKTIPKRQDFIDNVKNNIVLIEAVIN
tara:strand:+ start:176 stop:874 length:699 start_codon:yes stop_codon:yes gene_type:complete